jgi:hypothetical protein
MTTNPVTVVTAEEESPAHGMMLLVDPEWEKTEEAPEPTVGVILGAWRVTSDGERGRFEPNPFYEPITPGSPLDPLDSMLRRISEGAASADDLQVVLGDVMLGVALDDQGVALVEPAPDGVPSVLVTTAPGHRVHLKARFWLDVTVEQLAAALPEQGVDVLLNPGAPTSMRVLAEVIRSAAEGRDAGL